MMTLYTLTFLLACTLIGAFTAFCLIAYTGGHPYWGSLYAAGSVASMVVATGAWMKRQGVEP